MRPYVIAIVLLVGVVSVNAGLLAYGMCLETGACPIFPLLTVAPSIISRRRRTDRPTAGCNLVAGACYTAAGFAFSMAVASATTPDAVLTLGCNAAHGTCVAMCASVALP